MAPTNEISSEATDIITSEQQFIMGLAEKAVVSETRLGESQNPTEVKPKSSWKGYLWDTWTLPKDQRRLLFKLDAFVLTFASVRVSYCRFDLIK